MKGYESVLFASVNSTLLCRKIKARSGAEKLEQEILAPFTESGECCMKNRFVVCPLGQREKRSFERNYGSSV